MKTILLLLSFSIILGCMEEENYCDTLIVDHYETTETEFYTITEPVYKKEKC